MPQPQLERAQRGSILVVVVGLSLLITAVAAGYVALAANTSGQSVDAFSRVQTFHAAESGLHMGVRWCKGFTYTRFHGKWADNLVLTKSSSGLPGWTDFDGVWVKVVFDRPGDGTGGRNWITSYATKGAGRDTLKLTMQIDDADDGLPADSSDLSQYLKIWVDSLFPGK